MLSKETTDQIRKEAEEYSKKYFYSPSERLAGYQRGATAWAIWKQKAAAASIERDMLLLDKEGLRKALERAVGILETECDYEAVKELRATLEQFK